MGSGRGLPRCGGCRGGGGLCVSVGSTIRRELIALYGGSGGPCLAVAHSVTCRCRAAATLLVSNPQVVFVSPFLVTERYLWSLRPLMSQFPSCALCWSFFVRTCDSPGSLWGFGVSHVSQDNVLPVVWAPRARRGAVVTEPMPSWGHWGIGQMWGMGDGWHLLGTSGQCAKCISHGSDHSLRSLPGGDLFDGDSFWEG